MRKSLTQLFAEGILYHADDRKVMYECLKLCQIIDWQYRPYEPVDHPELYFLRRFRRPYFLIIVDNLMQVYVIGDRAFRSGYSKTDQKHRYNYNVLKFEGFNAYHYTWTGTDIQRDIRKDLGKTRKQFMPETERRIIFIKPNYDAEIFEKKLNDEHLFIFNKQKHTGSFFANDEWSLGVDIYSLSQPTYKIKASDILKSMMYELDDMVWEIPQGVNLTGKK